MMKKSLHDTIKRIGTLMLVLTIIISVLGHPAIAEDTNVYTEATSENLLRNQDEALDAYYALCDYFGMNDNTDYYIWPDKYAGCYIDSNNDLVICLTTDDEQLREKYTAICGDNVIFEVRKYSLGDFQELCMVLDQYRHASSLYVSFKCSINKLIIQILDDSTIEELLIYLQNYPGKNETLSKMIAESDNTMEISHDRRAYTTANLNPGSRIRNVDSFFTVCVWAYTWINNTQWLGIITCGHPFFTNHYYDSTKSTVSVYSNGSYIEFGYASSDRAYIDSHCDCAFIPRMNMTFSPTYTTPSGANITQTVASAPESTTVDFEGQKSGHVQGTVASIDLYAPAQFLTHGYGISMNTGVGDYIRDGDSGAPVSPMITFIPLDRGISYLTPSIAI